MPKEPDPNDDDLKNLEESYNLSETEEEQEILDELYMSYLHGKITGWLKAFILVSIVTGFCFVVTAGIAITALALMFK